MIIEQLRNLLIFGVILAVGVAVSYGYKANKPICPLDFKNQEEYLETVVSWLNNYYKTNPDASKEEVLTARMDYLLEMGCVDMSFEDSLRANT